MEGYDLDRKSGTSNLQLSSQDIHGYSLWDSNPQNPLVGKSILLILKHHWEKLTFKYQQAKTSLKSE